MKDLRVRCPNCKRCDFVTTEKYDPNVTPHGGMVRCTLPYAIDWLTVSTTLAAEMCCPECLAPLVVKGRLVVIDEETKIAVDEPVRVEAGDPVVLEQEATNVCDVCGKSFKTPFALAGHKRSHKK